MQYKLLYIISKKKHWSLSGATDKENPSPCSWGRVWIRIFLYRSFASLAHLRQMQLGSTCITLKIEHTTIGARAANKNLENLLFAVHTLNSRPMRRKELFTNVCIGLVIIYVDRTGRYFILIILDPNYGFIVNNQTLSYKESKSEGQSK